ncbi:MAG TPA: hypothetical protein VEI97_18830, partial [bacterium]|nr:hypothetical protein [bacterium]
GFVLNTTSTTTSSPPSQGRGVYYVWISADPNGTGVDPGDGTHDVVKVNAANGTFDTYSDANLWADPTDPTRAYVTMHHSPSGFTEDGLLFGNVFSANTANPTTQESTILPYTVGFQLDNNHAWMDRTTGDIHVTWEEFTPSVDRWVAYTRIHLNNPVGPRARLSMMSTVGSISNTGGPTVGVTTGGQAVVAFSADWDPTTGTDFDINLVKVQDNAGTLSFITPVTRLTEPTTGDGKPFILGDRVTGRLTVAFTASATNFQGSSGNRNVKYSIFDANLAPLIPNALPLQTVDPGVTYIHDDPWGAIDQNTGEVIYAWLEEPPIAANEMMAWRYSR